MVTKDRKEPVPASPPALGTHGLPECGGPPRWPVSGLAPERPSPSQARCFRRAQWLAMDGRGTVESPVPALTVAGAAQVGLATSSLRALLPVELRHANHAASTNAQILRPRCRHLPGGHDQQRAARVGGRFDDADHATGIRLGMRRDGDQRQRGRRAAHEFDLSLHVFLFVWPIESTTAMARRNMHCFDTRDRTGRSQPFGAAARHAGQHGRISVESGPGEPVGHY